MASLIVLCQFIRILDHDAQGDVPDEDDLGVKRRVRFRTATRAKCQSLMVTQLTTRIWLFIRVLR